MSVRSRDRIEASQHLEAFGSIEARLFGFGAFAINLFQYREASLFGIAQEAVAMAGPIASME